jgi:hypothetical protein
MFWIHLQYKVDTLQDGIVVHKDGYSVHGYIYIFENKMVSLLISLVAESQFLHMDMIQFD